MYFPPIKMFLEFSRGRVVPIPMGFYLLVLAAVLVLTTRCNNNHATVCLFKLTGALSVLEHDLGRLSNYRNICVYLMNTNMSFFFTVIAVVTEDYQIYNTFYISRQSPSVLNMGQELAYYLPQPIWEQFDYFIDHIQDRWCSPLVCLFNKLHSWTEVAALLSQISSLDLLFFLHGSLVFSALVCAAWRLSFVPCGNAHRRDFHCFCNLLIIIRRGRACSCKYVS